MVTSSVTTSSVTFNDEKYIKIEFDLNDKHLTRTKSNQEYRKEKLDNINEINKVKV